MKGLEDITYLSFRGDDTDYEREFDSYTVRNVKVCRKWSIDENDAENGASVIYILNGSAVFDEEGSPAVLPACAPGDLVIIGSGDGAVIKRVKNSRMSLGMTLGRVCRIEAV